MIADCFADTGYWVALVVKQDQLHDAARAWTTRITGRIVTTEAVLLETANTLSRPAWRSAAIRLIDGIRHRPDVVVIPWDIPVIARAWDMFKARADKAWSLTDCGSFVSMRDHHLNDALAYDQHFEPAGFRALLRWPCNQ